MQQKLARAPYWVIALFVFLFPIWTIPGVAGSVALHKSFLLVAIAGIMALLWAARTVTSKRVWLSLSPLNMLLLGLAMAVGVSGAITAGPLYQLSGRFLNVAAAAIFVLFATTLTPRLRWNQLLQLLLWSGVVLSVFTWLQLTPLSPSVWMNQLLGTALPTGLQYSLADNHLLVMSFLFPVGLSGLVAGLQSWQKDRSHKNAWLKGPLPWSIICLLTAAGVLGLTLTQPELSIAFLPYAQGWQIFIENLKSIRSTLFGVGPENFGVAFHRFRSVDYNALPIWNVRFTSSSSEFLQSATTTGLVSLAFWAGLLLTALAGLRRIWRSQPSLALFILSLVVVFFFLPFNYLLFFGLAVSLLALTSALQEEKPGYVKDVIFLLSAIRVAQPGSLKTVKTQAGFSLAIALVTGALVAGGLFFAGRVYAGSFFFELARQAAVKEDFRSAYQFQQSAVVFHPRNPLYHRTYAFTNLNIAKALARNESLTEEERVLVGRILQQAIRETRLAALLNPAETENWEALANVYSNILDVEGSPDWAVASMVQAIQTDPVHPSLRLNLGNLYLVLGDNEQALRLIEQAIQLKPDFGNSYISYGTVLERRNEPGLAAQSYQRALDLLGSDVDGASDLRARIQELQQLQQEKELKQSEEEAALEKSIAEAEAPSVPAEQPAVTDPPDEFGAIVEGRDPQAEQSNAPQPTPVVLPSDVGF